MNKYTIDTDQIDKMEKKIESYTYHTDALRNKLGGNNSSRRGDKDHEEFPIDIIKESQQKKSLSKKERHMIANHGCSNASWSRMGKGLWDASIYDNELWNLRTPGNKGGKTNNGDKTALKCHLKALQSDIAYKSNNISNEDTDSDRSSAFKPLW